MRSRGGVMRLFLAGRGLSSTGSPNLMGDCVPEVDVEVGEGYRTPASGCTSGELGRDGVLERLDSGDAVTLDSGLEVISSMAGWQSKANCKLATRCSGRLEVTREPRSRGAGEQASRRGKEEAKRKRKIPTQHRDPRLNHCASDRV